MTTSPRTALRTQGVELVVERAVGAALLTAMGGLHLHLWVHGYSELGLIGIMFLFNVIGSGLLALAVLLAPRRFLSPLAAPAAVFTLGTLLALVLSLTVSLFGFREDVHAALVPTTLTVESAGTLVLALLAVHARRPPGP